MVNPLSRRKHSGDGLSWRSARKIIALGNWWHRWIKIQKSERDRASKTRGWETVSQAGNEKKNKKSMGPISSWLKRCFRKWRDVTATLLSSAQNKEAVRQIMQKDEDIYMCCDEEKAVIEQGGSWFSQLQPPLPTEDKMLLWQSRAELPPWRVEVEVRGCWLQLLHNYHTMLPFSFFPDDSSPVFLHLILLSHT